MLKMQVLDLYLCFCPKLKGNEMELSLCSPIGLKVLCKDKHSELEQYAFLHIIKHVHAPQLDPWRSVNMRMQMCKKKTQ